MWLARGLLSVLSAAARGGPVRPTARNPGSDRSGALQATVTLHLGISLVLAGVASQVAANLFVIDARVFLVAASALTLLLIWQGTRAMRAGRVIAGRGWLFWGGIAWGLVVGSGAYVTHLTGYIPHLWLLWTVGVLVLGLLGASAVQTAFAGLLGIVWVLLAAYVGESLLPGVVQLIALGSFPVLARPSRLVGGLSAALFLALAVATALRYLPQVPALPLTVVTLLAAAAAAESFAGRLPVLRAGGIPPPGCPSYGIRTVTTRLAQVALIGLPLPIVWRQLSDSLATAGPRPWALFVPPGIAVVVVSLPGVRRAGSTRRAAGLAAAALATGGALLAGPAATAAAAVAVACGQMAWSMRTSMAARRARYKISGLVGLLTGLVQLVLLLPPLGSSIAAVVAGGWVTAVAMSLRVDREPPKASGATRPPGRSPMPSAAPAEVAGAAGVPGVADPGGGPPAGTGDPLTPGAPGWLTSSSIGAAGEVSR
jgi:hypothetical protein